MLGRIVGALWSPISVLFFNIEAVCMVLRNTERTKHNFPIAVLPPSSLHKILESFVRHFQTQSLHTSKRILPS